MSYRESKESSSSDDNEDYEDLRVLAVIESNEKISKRSNEKSTIAKGAKTCVNKARNVSVVKTEVIILDEPPTAQTFPRSDNTSVAKFRNNPRVIELSDDKSKMELRREFKVDVAKPELSVGVSSDSRKNIDVDDNDDDNNKNNDNENVVDDDGSADILSRLPPGTILIKQSSANCSSAATSGITRICSREDSDYVHDSSKDSTGTNSSESSSTASYNTAGKVRRMQYRSVRSKKVVEVRRNPARNKKKKPIDEDFTRPRQRLLAIKRKSSSFVVDNTTRKRTRQAPTPYMNTRSVTRKMYTVGATYQAPTPNDALEWKEWPSHGMHERPIWHPQIGLAYEYNERSYVSLDGSNYREIIEDPVIEVVSVDPHHPERMSMSGGGRRNFERMRYYNTAPRSSLELMDNNRESYVMGNNSFQSCMHGSFHSVLAYCARVVAPNFKRNVDMKLRAFAQTDDTHVNPKIATKLLPDNPTRFSQEPVKMRIPSMIVPGIGSANLAKNPEINNFPSTSSSSNDQIPKCLVIPRKTIHFTNVRNIQGNILQEVFNRSSKNTLIFLKPTDPPGKTAEKIAAALKSSTPKINCPKSKDFPDTSTSQLNLTKLDDSAISDEALMEMSSIYNNILPSEDTDSKAANKSYRATNYLTRPVTALVATKIPVKSSIGSDSSMENQNYKISRASCSSHRGVIPGSTIKHDTPNTTRFAYSNQAAEIAKILAEYNQKAAKNSSIRSSANPRYTAAAAAASNILSVRSTTAGSRSSRTNNQYSVNSLTSRNNFLSIVEQPKNLRIKREQDLSESTESRCSFSANAAQQQQQQCGPNFRKVISSTITSVRDEIMSRNDDNQAMDLTTVRQREMNNERKIEIDKTSESRKWLQELIEDTAMLYCAAAGSRQGDVAEYMDTLDSVQSLQWLGS